MRAFLHRPTALLLLHPNNPTPLLPSAPPKERATNLSASVVSSTDEKEVSAKGVTAVKRVVFATLIAVAFAAEPLYSVQDFASYLISGALLTSTVFVSIEACYSFGYGAILLTAGARSALTLLKYARALPSTPTPTSTAQALGALGPGARLAVTAGLLHAFAYAAYALRLMSFIARRNASQSYQRSDARAALQAAEKKIPLQLRLGIWLGTALLVGVFYTLPLHLHTSTVLHTPSPSRALAVISILSSTLALGAIAVEHIADNQKLAHKERVNGLKLPSPALPFCTSGLYSKYRHPNYAADFVFHVCMYMSAAPAFTPMSPFAIWYTHSLSFVGPYVFASIIRAATTTQEERQGIKYGQNEAFREAYEAWVARTRRFL